jgi:Rrf2 family protein
MELRLTTKYALQSLALLARRGEASTSVRELCDRLKVPQKYLGRLMPRLRRAGLVKVLRGAAGGYRLAREPTRIPLRAVVEATQGLDGFLTCMLGSDSCARSEGACMLHAFWGPHRAAILDTLERVTIADLAGAPGGGPTEGLPTFRTRRPRRRPAEARRVG